MLEKGKFMDGERKQWKDIMIIDAMSSEESDMEEGDDVIVVHPLPWLSQSVVQLKLTLDDQIKSSKSPQARRQMKKRLLGSPSKRDAADSLPPWADMNNNKLYCGKIPLLLV
jgi:hypothetical protein